MSRSSGADSFSDSDNLCVVCCKTIDIYSVGVCDHPVCFECSTRMRVLCNTKECPICRGQMPKVIFTKDVAHFEALFAKFGEGAQQDRKFGLVFCSDDIKKSYQQLLENRCDICTKGDGRKCTFYTFQQLKDHMRREHGLVYCDLCVDNLKIFCSERKCYTKQQLGYHRRKGDPDNTSHRGHPLCEFCDTRFVDSDELFRHLRRNHFFCHFCDADGKHQYYISIEALLTHFREDHYLCEEGSCVDMPLTAVFRSDIDMKAHKAIEHSRSMSRSASKQARTLELEFMLAPRPGAGRGRQLNLRHDEEGAVGYDMEPGGPGGGVRQVHSLTPQDFPTLGNSTVTVQSHPSTTVNFTSKVNPFSNADFPSLGGSRAPAVTITTNSTSRRKPPEVTITRNVRGGSAQKLQKNTDNFPRLGPPSNSSIHLSVNNSQHSAPKVSIHVNHNGGVTTTHITTTPSSSNGFNVNQRPTEAFPALGPTSAPLNPQWIQPKKTEPKIRKVAPPPQLPPSDLKQFPTLSKAKSEKNLKKSSVTVPVSGSWTAVSKQKTKNETSKNVEDGKTKNKKQKKKNEENDVVKRSELNIGALSLSDDAKPPPGFPAKPPPGLTNQNFPDLINNDLTFTSSSGQSYSIKPSNYHQPSNFSTRNQNLIKRAMEVLDNDVIKEFKSYSAIFRDGDLPSDRYYEYCQALLGDHFKELFPELLVLLPNIEKQQELYRACDLESKKHLVACENCKQIVFKRELKEHYNYHALESHFPSLSNSAEPSAWKK